MTTNYQTAEKATAIGRQLQARLAAASARLGQTGRPTLISVSLPLPALDPLAFFAGGAALFPHRCFWTHPQSGLAFAGLGVAWSASGSGARRFAEAADAWRELCAEALIEGATPVALGGFSFDPQRPHDPLWEGFPDGLLTLPRLLLARRDDACELTINLVLRPGEAPPAEVLALLRRLDLLVERAAAPESPPAADRLQIEGGMSRTEWSAMLRAAIAQIDRSGMEKVVLARTCRVQAAHPFDPATALARLRATYPGCFTFALERGPRCFLGASPERLVSLRDGLIAASCLAGSIARGSSAAEDARLGQHLLTSSKDRVEHAIVLRELLAALSDLSHDLSAPPAPALMRMPNVQHLFTPVTGRAAAGVGVLDLVARLHPTPAVGGAPRGAAMALIRASEPVERGWYAAPVGWLDAHGQGEFAVALRSGLLHGASATLYAGCGIVAASDPAREYDEARLKLRPMLSALGQTNAEDSL